ncbi:MAG TPA: class I SAM-dependent methyltransferase [Kofleriaceae bacterium]
MARFSTWSFFAFVAQFLAVAAMYVALPEMLHPESATPRLVSVAIVTLLAALVFLVRRTQSLTHTALLFIDAAGVLLISLELGSSAYLSHNVNGNVFPLFVLNVFLLVGHALAVPTSKRWTALLSTLAMIPLAAATLAAPPHVGHLVLPLPILAIGIVGIGASVVGLVTWIAGSAIRHVEPTVERDSITMPRFLVPLVRALLQLAQHVCVKIANAFIARPALRTHHAWDLLLAHRLSAHLRDGDAVLDVGCGLGRRLQEMSMFRALRRAHGVDVVKPPPDFASEKILLDTFDGETLPFADKSFDVTMICYVLHHMPQERAQKLLREIVRVTRRSVIVLEDSLPVWSAWYRFRNWCHRVDADLEYSGGSLDYLGPGGQQMFLTHEEWARRLGALPGASDVICETLQPEMKYRHHTMFRMRVD